MKKFLSPSLGDDTPNPRYTIAKSVAREIIEFIILVVLIVLPLRFFVAEPYIVLGASMSETFETSHYLIINKFWHKMHGVERGDVLVFSAPTDETKSYIKRVIALPGETIRIENQEVQIKQVGSDEFITIYEPYIKNKTFSKVEVTLKEDQYFMMGDNRGNSFDSRNWGALDGEHIKGEAVLRLYPFTNINYLPGTYSDYTELTNTVTPSN